MSRDRPRRNSRSHDQGHADTQAIRMIDRSRRSDTSQALVGSPRRNLTADSYDSIPGDRESELGNVGQMFGPDTQTEEPASMFDTAFAVDDGEFPAQEQDQALTHHLPHQQQAVQPQMRTQSNPHADTGSWLGEQSASHPQTSNIPEIHHAQTQRNDGNNHHNNAMRLSMQAGATPNVPVMNGASRNGRGPRPRRRNVIHQNVRATQPPDRVNGMTTNRQLNGTHDDA